MSNPMKNRSGTLLVLLQMPCKNVFRSSSPLRRVLGTLIISWGVDLSYHVLPIVNKKSSFLVRIPLLFITFLRGNKDIKLSMWTDPVIRKKDESLNCFRTLFFNGRSIFSPQKQKTVRNFKNIEVSALNTKNSHKFGILSNFRIPDPHDCYRLFILG